MNQQDKVLQYIEANYPQYKGYRLRSLAWEYNIGGLASEFANTAEEAYKTFNEIIPEDFDDLLETVEPPEGYAYITIQKHKKRIGINVPVSVFQS